MIYEVDHYSSAGNWPLEHFNPAEVADSRDGSVRLWVPFGRKLDILRRSYGGPVHVNSWYRTESHDAAIGGKGNHTGGWAADVRADDMYKLLHCICAVGFAGVGVAKSFIHVDDNLDYINRGKRPALWTY